MMPFIRLRLVSLPLILFVAFLARGAYAWHAGRQLSPEVRATVPFFQETGNIARALALGHGFSDLFRQGTGPTAWLAPIYPLILSGIFRAFGIFTSAAFTAAVILNIVFSAATCVPIFLAGRKIAATSAGATAAWLWALYPNAIIIPFQWIWDTSLTALLAGLIFWFTLKIAESVRMRDWSVYGLVWGLSLMTNPALGSLLPFLVGWAAYRASPRLRQRAALAGLAVFFAVLCCTPWTVRNYIAFHRFVPLRSTFPFALWLAHNHVWDPHAPWNARVTAYEQNRKYQQLGEDRFMDEKWTEALEFIRTHPELEVDLFVRRFVAFWLGVDSPVEQFAHAESLGDRILLLTNFLVASGALAGLIVAWIRYRRFAFILSAFPIVFPSIYYATQPYVRYRLPIDPVLLLLAALALNVALPPSSRRSIDNSPGEPLTRTGPDLAPLRMAES